MNLQTALIALGVLLVAGIYLFSRWQDGRGGKPETRPKRGRSEMSEPSLGRDEPSLGEELTRDMDADLSGAESPLTEDSSPPPDWDALENEMAQPAQPLGSDLSVDPPGDAIETGIEDSASEVLTGESRTIESEPADHEPAEQEPVEQEPVEQEPVEQEPVEPVTPRKAPAVDSGYPSNPDSAVADPDVAEDSMDQRHDDIPILEARVDDAEAEILTPSAPPKEATQPQPSATEQEQDAEPDLPVLEDNVTDPVTDPDVTEEDADSDLDMRDARPSLGSFLGSLKPINKLRHSLQNRLDAVKAEREETSGDSVEDSEHDVMPKKSKSSGQVDLLDLTVPADPDSEREERGGAGDAQPDTAPELSSGPDADDEPASREDARKPPVLNMSDQDNDLQPAPGFDKLSQIDYYVKLSGERDVSRDSVLAVYREAAAGLSKSHSVYGLRLPDKVWRDLEHEPEESRFGDLVITVQLADNSGPVSEQEMTRFSNLVVKLSESTGRGFAFMAPIENAYQQALAIDRLRRKFDSIFVVNIKPVEDEFFEGAMIDRCASQIGLTPDDNRFYARYKPVGKQKVCLYSMANMTDNGEFEIGNMRGTRTRGVTFFTRPAVNRSPGAVFSEMVDAAKAFASRVKGEPIAPGYDDLSSDDIDAIRRSIEKVAREMESYGIVPGSEEASRLF